MCSWQVQILLFRYSFLGNVKLDEKLHCPNCICKVILALHCQVKLVHEVQWKIMVMLKYFKYLNIRDIHCCGNKGAPDCGVDTLYKDFFSIFREWANKTARHRQRLNHRHGHQMKRNVGRKELENHYEVETESE